MFFNLQHKNNFLEILQKTKFILQIVFKSLLEIVQIQSYWGFSSPLCISRNCKYKLKNKLNLTQRYVILLTEKHFKV